MRDLSRKMEGVEGRENDFALAADGNEELVEAFQTATNDKITT